MRYLVYLLVLANVALFTWYWYNPSPKPVMQYSVASPPGIDRLVLLSERFADEDPPASIDESSGDPAEAQATVEAQEPDTVEQTAAVDVAVVTEPASEAVDDIKNADSESANAVAEPPAPICQTVGPFLDKSDVTSVFKLLATRGYEVAIRDGDVREPDGYWVYLPAMSANRAREIVADLDARGMKDYFIGKQNHISLGIFSDADKARARQQRIKSLGYTAILDPRFRMRDVFWIDIQQASAPLLGSVVWEKIQSEHPDIRVQRVSCE